MARSDQHEVKLRIVVERPVVGVAYSLQDKNDLPLDPTTSLHGESLAFDFTIRVGPGPKFLGDQVRREGPTRRFVYLRIGTMAGDPASPWSRRMKIDIHDIPAALLERAVDGGDIVETVVIGTAADGSPACATIRPTDRRLITANS